ncbi:hypothetical protein, partial [Klebsiella pneumoniae]|uniref:hypothetical protein n=1 Tax=Klebsiella pneumoniae TaxID=573 RepID=UPI00405598E7
EDISEILGFSLTQSKFSSLESTSEHFSDSNTVMTHQVETDDSNSEIGKSCESKSIGPLSTLFNKSDTSCNETEANVSEFV